MAYLYVLDADDQLLGVIQTTDLLAAADDTLISHIMKAAAVTLDADSTLKDAIELFTRYGYQRYRSLTPIARCSASCLTAT